MYSVFPFQSNRIFNTWVGDPSKVLLLETVVKVIARDNLLSQVKVTGRHLLNELIIAQVRKLDLNMSLMHPSRCILAETYNYLNIHQ